MAGSSESGKILGSHWTLLQTLKNLCTSMGIYPLISANGHGKTSLSPVTLSLSVELDFDAIKSHKLIMDLGGLH